MKPSEKGFRDSNTWGVICSSHSHKTRKRWEQVRSYVEEKGVVYEFFASDGKEEIGRTFWNALFKKGGDGLTEPDLRDVLNACRENK